MQPPAARVDGSEDSKHSDQAVTLGIEAESQVDLRGGENTIPQQTVTENHVARSEAAGREETPRVDSRSSREPNRKQEEKTNDDHGGEELVEGQEDDVIY